MGKKQEPACEKRKFLRLPLPYRVEAREIQFPIARMPIIDATSYDISRGGLCIESKVQLEIGYRLHITVHVPLLNKFTNGFFKELENETEQYFESVAEVAWSKQYEQSYLVGLKFINADKDIITGLDHLINKAFLDIRYPTLNATS